MKWMTRTDECCYGKCLDDSWRVQIEWQVKVTSKDDKYRSALKYLVTMGHRQDWWQTCAQSVKSFSLSVPRRWLIVKSQDIRQLINYLVGTGQIRDEWQVQMFGRSAKSLLSLSVSALMALLLFVLSLPHRLWPEECGWYVLLGLSGDVGLWAGKYI